MSGRVALREELTRHAKRHAEKSQRAKRGTVTATSPLTVVLFDFTIPLTEDNDFWLSQWATFYHKVVGIEIDDVVLMHQEDDWVLFDVITDKDVSKAFNTWRAG